MAIPFTFIEACAGVGTLGLGFKLAIEQHFGRPAVCLANIEREGSAATALLARCEEESLVPSPIWCGDIESFPSESFVGCVDGIIAGIPCPSFSMAGNRGGTDDERWLWPALWDLATKLRVDWIALENVFGFISGGGLIAIADQLAKERWSAEWLHLRASDVGASHERERIFLLACKNNPVEWIRRARRSGGLQVPKSMEVERAFGGLCIQELPEQGGGEEMEEHLYAPSDHECGRSGEFRGGSHQSEQEGQSEKESTVGGALEKPTQPCPEGQQLDGVKGCPDEPAGRLDSANLSGSNSELADTSDRQLSEPGWGAQGRDGAGPAGAAMGDTNSQRKQQQDDTESAIARGDARGGASWASGELADAKREPVSAEQQQEPREESRGPQRAIDGSMSGDAGANVADSLGAGLEERGCIAGNAGQEFSATERNNLPLFAPGPNDPRWMSILDRFPWLAPALPKLAVWEAGNQVDPGDETSAQPNVRKLANGHAAYLLDQSRADSLRASGNSCVWLQAKIAFSELFRRIDG